MAQKMLLSIVFLAVSLLGVHSARSHDYGGESESAGLFIQANAEMAANSTQKGNASSAELEQRIRDDARLDDAVVVGGSGAVNGHDAAVLREVVNMEDAEYAATKLEIEVAERKVLAARDESNKVDAEVVAARRTLKEYMQNRTEASSVAHEQKALLEQEKAELKVENDKLILATKNFKKLDTTVAEDQAELVRLQELATNALAHLRHLEREMTTAKAALARQQVIVDHRRERAATAAAAAPPKL